jgi:RNA polymerase sigma-70 factor (ECF subfamily)
MSVTAEGVAVEVPPAEDFEEFFTRAKPRLLRQAYAYVADIEEAQDLVQETLTRCWRNWSRVRRFDNPDAWARNVLHNLAVGWWRRRHAAKRFARTARRSPEWDTRAGHADLSATVAVSAAEHLDLARALSSLRHQERRVLVLKAVVGLSVSEIAVEVGASEGTVRVWLSRARTAVASQMEMQSPRNERGVNQSG